MDVPCSFDAKYRWLRRHFPFIPPSHIVFCGDKGIVDADYLIDDRPRHLERFKGHTLLFSAPHNSAERRFHRVDVVARGARPVQPRRSHAVALRPQRHPHAQRRQDCLSRVLLQALSCGAHVRLRQQLQSSSAGSRYSFQVTEQTCTTNGTAALARCGGHREVARLRGSCVRRVAGVDAERAAGSDAICAAVKSG